MKAYLLPLAIAAIALPAPAHAMNELILISSDPLQNVATLELTGSSNRLQIVQEHFGGGSGNSIALTIDGDFNGGPLGAEFTGAARLAGLQPGSLTQRGYGNSMTFDVIGSHNLFAAAQIGNNNVINAAITGSYNQASVMQVGNNNFVGFSQTGFGNTVSVMQTSW